MDYGTFHCSLKLMLNNMPDALLKFVFIFSAPSDVRVSTDHDASLALFKIYFVKLIQEFQFYTILPHCNNNIDSYYIKFKITAFDGLVCQIMATTKEGRRIMRNKSSFIISFPRIFSWLRPATSFAAWLGLREKSPADHPCPGLSEVDPDDWC